MNPVSSSPPPILPVDQLTSYLNSTTSFIMAESDFIILPRLLLRTLHLVSCPGLALFTHTPRYLPTQAFIPP
ncbi:hypothetical protein IF1G_06629 [Cordyceps javanica]|uniref:Uncharacterized protein n=1 Tax=Cordyceps javanica TaxID=43265 RepID=A0A545UYV1_9HYPO|nr:hypothetical protein IF1G_06629 [Cordyceps javanica]